MRIECNREELLNALLKVSRAVVAQSPLKEITGVLVRTDGDRVTLTGYDLSFGIVCSIPCAVMEEGSVVIPPPFLDIVRKATGSTVRISKTDENIIAITCGNADYKLFGFQGENYPELPVFEEEHCFEIPVAALQRLIRQSVFCVSTAEGKPVQQGTLFEIDNGMILLVSQDGFRMAISKERINYLKNAKFIVPGKTLNEIARIIGENGVVKMSVGKNHCCLMTDSCVIYARLVTQGEYVNYKPIIPKDHSTLVRIKTREFLDCMERVAILVDGVGGKKLKNSVLAEFRRDELTLNCITMQGKAQDKIGCQKEGADIEIGINSSFMLDALRAADCDELCVRMNSPRSAIKLTPPEDESFIFLVMPVKANND